MDRVNHQALFDIQRRGMTEAIRKAIMAKPSIEWFLQKPDIIVHGYHQKGIDGTLQGMPERASSSVQ
jgi:hypothetical protein